LVGAGLRGRNLTLLWESHEVDYNVKGVRAKHDMLKYHQRLCLWEAEGHIVSRGKARVSNDDEHVGVENVEVLVLRTEK